MTFTHKNRNTFNQENHITSWIVKVPATAANLGPGFDVLGLALGIYNTFKVRKEEKGFSLKITGMGSENLPRDESNLAIQAFSAVIHENGKKMEGFHFEIDNNFPLAKGLGSSASAIIGGISLAYQVLDLPFMVEEILKSALPFEGHADNLVPALLGGLQLVYYDENELRFKKLIPHPDLAVILVIPEGEISTQKARKSLPEHVSIKDCVFNMHCLAMSIQCLIEGDCKDLVNHLKDRIHQFHRIKLLDGLEELFMDLQKEFPGWVISGSGPTLLHFVEIQEQASISVQIEEIVKGSKLNAQVLHCIPVTDGVLCLKPEPDE